MTIVTFEVGENDWVSKKGFAAEKVISQDVISGWMQRHWVKGEHYCVVGRQTFVNRKKANAWITEQGSMVEGGSGD